MLISCYNPKKDFKSMCCDLTSFCRLSFSWQLLLHRRGLWEKLGQASLNPLHPEEHRSRPDPAAPSKEPQEKQQNTVTLSQKEESITHQIIVIHVIGRQHPHFHRVGVRSRFLCWNDRCYQASPNFKSKLKDITVPHLHDTYTRVYEWYSYRGFQVFWPLFYILQM